MGPGAQAMPSAMTSMPRDRAKVPGQISYTVPIVTGHETFSLLGLPVEMVAEEGGRRRWPEKVARLATEVDNRGWQSRLAIDAGNRGRQSSSTIEFNAPGFRKMRAICHKRPFFFRRHGGN